MKKPTSSQSRPSTDSEVFLSTVNHNLFAIPVQHAELSIAAERKEQQQQQQQQQQKQKRPDVKPPFLLHDHVIVSLSTSHIAMWRTMCLRMRELLTALDSSVIMEKKHIVTSAEIPIRKTRRTKTSKSSRVISTTGTAHEIDTTNHTKPVAAAFIQQQQQQQQQQQPSEQICKNQNALTIRSRRLGYVRDVVRSRQTQAVAITSSGSSVQPERKTNTADCSSGTDSVVSSASPTADEFSADLTLLELAESDMIGAVEHKPNDDVSHPSSTTPTDSMDVYIPIAPMSTTFKQHTETALPGHDHDSSSSSPDDMHSSGGMSTFCAPTTTPTTAVVKMSDIIPRQLSPYQIAWHFERNRCTLIAYLFLDANDPRSKLVVGPTVSMELDRSFFERYDVPGDCTFTLSLLDLEEGVLNKYMTHVCHVFITRQHIYLSPTDWTGTDQVIQSVTYSSEPEAMATLSPRLAVPRMRLLDVKLPVSCPLAVRAPETIRLRVPHIVLRNELRGLESATSSHVQLVYEPQEARCTILATRQSQLTTEPIWLIFQFSLPDADHQFIEPRVAYERATNTAAKQNAIVTSMPRRYLLSALHSDERTQDTICITFQHHGPVRLQYVLYESWTTTAQEPDERPVSCVSFFCPPPIV